MINTISAQTQKFYNHLFNTQNFQQPASQAGDIEKAHFSSEKNSQSIRNPVYRFLNQSKSNLSILIGASAAFLYLIQKTNNQAIQIADQSRQIAILKENMATIHNKQFYLKDEKPSSEYIKDEFALNENSIQDQLSDFSESRINKNGVLYHPYGIVEQWGEGVSDKEGILDVEFDIPFKDETVINIISSPYHEKGTGIKYTANSTNVKFYTSFALSGVPASSRNITWRAIGKHA